MAYYKAHPGLMILALSLWNFCTSYPTFISLFFAFEICHGSHKVAKAWCALVHVRNPLLDTGGHSEEVTLSSFKPTLLVWDCFFIQVDLAYFTANVLKYPLNF